MKAALLATALAAAVLPGQQTIEAGAAPTDDGPLAETTVGMRVRIDELPLPGPRLRARPVEDPQKAEMILRVRNVFRHGTGWRYNLEVTPLVPGTLDLRDHLEREDGSGTDDLPELPIEVAMTLPPGRIQPNELDPVPVEEVGGYRTWAIVVGVAWLLGLLAILFVGRRRRRARAAPVEEAPRTLADRLRPLVEAARAGSIDDTDRARLERLLLAHWRRRRRLEGVKAADAIARLRRDEEAGPLLVALEDWLHRPPGSGGRDVDVAALLEPYRDVPEPPPGADTAEEEPGR